MPVRHPTLNPQSLFHPPACWDDVLTDGKQTRCSYGGEATHNRLIILFWRQAVDQRHLPILLVLATCVLFADHFPPPLFLLGVLDCSARFCFCCLLRLFQPWERGHHDGGQGETVTLCRLPPPSVAMSLLVSGIPNRIGWLRCVRK